jgi:hypothetical protein
MDQMRELEKSDLRWVSGGLDSWQVDLSGLSLYGDGHNIYAGYDWNFDSQSLTIGLNLNDFDTWNFHFDSDKLDLNIHWNEDNGAWDVGVTYTTDYNWTVSASTNSGGGFSLTASYSVPF